MNNLLAVAVVDIILEVLLDMYISISKEIV